MAFYNFLSTNLCSKSGLNLLFYSQTQKCDSVHSPFRLLGTVNDMNLLKLVLLPLSSQLLLILRKDRGQQLPSAYFLPSENEHFQRVSNLSATFLRELVKDVGQQNKSIIIMGAVHKYFLVSSFLPHKRIAHRPLSIRINHGTCLGPWNVHENDMCQLHVESCRALISYWQQLIGNNWFFPSLTGKK